MSFFSTFLDLLELPKVAAPYILHPLTAAETFFPHMQPISWFANQVPFVPENDVESLAGKVILVTGGNAGLGQETVYQLARHGPAKIYLTARSRQKYEDAIKQIRQRLHDSGIELQTELEYLQLDLSDAASINNAAHEVLSGPENRLDILILNAGIMATPPSRTAAGYDLQLGTNHIGHFVLTKLLLSLLEHTAASVPGADVRVVTVSSEAYHIAPSNFLDLIEDQEKLCRSRPYTRYGVSKTANILFAAELARRCNSKNILSVSLHPGLIMTGLYAHTKDANLLVKYSLQPVANLVFDDVAHGALSQIWCAAGAKRDELVNGAYYTPVGRRRAIALVDDADAATMVWEWTEKQASILLG